MWVDVVMSRSTAVRVHSPQFVSIKLVDELFSRETAVCGLPRRSAAFLLRALAEHGVGDRRRTCTRRERHRACVFCRACQCGKKTPNLGMN